MQVAVQRSQVPRIAGLQQKDVLASKTEPAQNGLRHGDLLLQRLPVLGGLFVGQQYPHLGGAVGDGSQPQFQTSGGGVPQRHRQHPGRHTTRAVAPVALKLRSAA